MWLSVVVVSFLAWSAWAGPVAHLEQGDLEGAYGRSFRGKEYAAFLGVPYAEVPRRFQLPELRSTSWEGVKPAKKMMEDCLQYSELGFKIHGSEDCLYANIYTPTNFNRTDKLYDVIIYIHGGGFSYMTSHYGPKYILDHDVILVTFTYRLGPLGFLSTGDEVIPGNLGLKDQAVLLKWVSKNIRQFGGNPNQVTITGTSAGGASVHYHILSPLSKGLFHRAFSMSGSAFCCWTQMENAREKAVTLASNLGCSTNTSQEILDCLLTKTATDIVGQMKMLQNWLYFPFSPFAPVVEPESPTAFISKYPSEIITNGEAQEVPWLITLTSQEGLFPTADFVANLTALADLDLHWNEYLPCLLDYQHTTTFLPKDEISRRIREKYIKTKSVKDDIAGLIDMCSDRLFVYCTLKAARLHAQYYKSPVYSYYFSYRGKHSASEAFSGSMANFGVSHGDDTGYIFEFPEINVEDSEKDKEMINVMTNLMVKFAASGKPSNELVKDWPTINTTCNSNTYVHIKDPKVFVIESDSNLGHPNFWAALKLAED